MKESPARHSIANSTLTAVAIGAQPKTGGTGILLDTFFGQDGSRISEVTCHCSFDCVMHPARLKSYARAHNKRPATCTLTSEG